MVQPLTPERRAALPGLLPRWRLSEERDAIERAFRFRDFNEAFGFVTRVAMLAERADHHPEWSNAWNRVTVLLTTHDAGGLSERDVSMALAIEALLGER